MSRAHAHDLWRRFLNPDYVGLLEALDFGRAFVRARKLPPAFFAEAAI